MTNHNHAQRSALVPALLAFGFAWLTNWLWKYGQAGSEASAFGSLITGFIAAKLTLEAFSNCFFQLHSRRALRAARETAGQHGNARWADKRALRLAGLTGKTGLVLGKACKRILRYNGESHLLTVAPPGAGKGVAQVIINLLLYPGSVVVTDLKGELFAVTAKIREKLFGHKIVVLCPWYESLSRELGIEIPDHGFNPLAFLHKIPFGELKDFVELLVSLLITGKPNSSANDEYWSNSGREILVGVILYCQVVYTYIDLTLIRRKLNQSPEAMFEMLDDMSNRPELDGVIAEYGGLLLSRLKNAPQQFEGGLSVAQQALKIYDAISPLGYHCSRGELDFASLKETPTTVYLIMPGERAITHAAWLNTTISLAMEQVGRDRSNKRVLFLLDEFANMGYVANVLKAMAQYRSQGVQCWSFIQNLNQLRKLYGHRATEEFIGMSDVVSAFGVWEPEALKMFSGWLGQKTVRNFSQSITPEQQSAAFGHQFNASDFGVPLMRPEDIRTMPDNEMLIFHRNTPPIRAKKLNYLKDRKLRKRAQPNPYYRKK